MIYEYELYGMALIGALSTLATYQKKRVDMLYDKVVFEDKPKDADWERSYKSLNNTIKTGMNQLDEYLNERRSRAAFLLETLDMIELPKKA